MTNLQIVPPATYPVVAEDTDTLAAFRAWLGAVEAANALRKSLVGRRIKFVGMLRSAQEQTQGRITRVSAGGLGVKWDDGRVEVVHPDSVVFI